MEFTLKDTNIVKAIAIIMLLIDHLFFVSQNNLFTDINLFTYHSVHYGLFYILSALCKPTVTLFVFLSGIGLYKSFTYIDSKNYILNFG